MRKSIIALARYFGLRRSVSSVVSTIRLAAEELDEITVRNYDKVQRLERECSDLRQEARHASRVSEKLGELIA